MNECHKGVIQRHYRNLADDIIITEELLGSFFQMKVFDRGMIDLIKVEKTPTEKTYKMLAILPKRGPEAFDAFIEILKTDYPWLSAMLETSYKNATEALSRQNSFTCTCGGLKIAGEMSIPMLPTEMSIIQRRPSADLSGDPDIKGRVGTFIHKQFGQSKRISQLDKKAMEKFFSEQLNYERKRLKKATPSSSCIDEIAETTERGSCTSPMPLHDDLRRVYHKLRDENYSDSLCNTDRRDNGSDEIDGGSGGDIDNHAFPTDLATVVTKMESEIDTLINRVNELEGNITQCHYILGDPDKKQRLPNLVKDMKYKSKLFEKEITKEKEKSEKMLTELYDYCKSINKLEQLRTQQRYQLEKKIEEIEEIKAKNVEITEELKVLKAAEQQHIEKEKTLDNLRKMVQDLKNNHNSLVDENTNMRSNVGGSLNSLGGTKGFRRPFNRTQRRGSIVDGNSIMGSFRKTTTKTSLNTSRRKPAVPRFN